MKLKNIIIVNDYDYIQGGASKVAIDTANLLTESKEKFNVYFFSGNSNQTSTLNDKVVKISTNQCEALKDKNKFRGMINGIYNFKAKKIFKELLETLNKDETVIHVHGWTKCISSSIYDIAFKMNFKVILTFHDYFTACPNGGYFNYKKNQICKLKPLSFNCMMCNCDSRNFIFKYYRIIRQLVQNNIVKLNKKLEYGISISDFSYNILKDTLNNRIKIEKIYNPIELPKEVDKIDDILKNEYFLYVGRITKEKGVDIFCEALSKTKNKGVVVGDGNQKQILQEKYKNIKFVGWKNKEEVKEYMKNAKALIFPSRWYEGAPLTIIEAMSIGLPCIVSDCCSAIEFIENNENGIYFNIKKNNLEQKIEEFNNLNRKIMSLKAMESYNKYNKNNYILKLLNYYKEIEG